MKRNMKSAMAMAALAALVPLSGWGYGPQGEGRHQGLSPQAIEACAQKSAGDAVEFTTRRGTLKSAVCRDVKGQLVAVPEGRAHRGGAGDRMERFARALELTEEQRAEIADIKSAQREKTAPLREKMRQSREELRRLTEGGTFDEAAVRTLAAAQAEIRTEMIVARAEARSRVHALLTPEQRAKAAELIQKRGKKGGCRTL